MKLRGVRRTHKAKSSSGVEQLRTDLATRFMYVLCSELLVCALPLLVRPARRAVRSWSAGSQRSRPRWEMGPTFCGARPASAVPEKRPVATRPARSRNRGAHRLAGKKQAFCGPKPRSDVVTWIHRPIKLEEAVVTDLLGLFWSVVTLEVAPPGRVVQGSKGPPSMSLGRVGLAGPAEQRYWRLAAGPSLVWVTIRAGPNGRRFALRVCRRPRRGRKE